MIVLSIIALVAALGVGLLLSRGIARALRKLQGAAETIAEGDIDHDIVASGIAEITPVEDAFGEMTAYLKEMADAADEIAAGHLNVEVRSRSERDRLANAFVAMSPCCVMGWATSRAWRRWSSVCSRCRRVA